MSWSDEELDNLFKEAAEKQSVPYRSEYWDEMEALLGKEKKRRIGFWWWTSAGVLLLILGSVATYYLMDNKQISSDSDKVAQNEIQSTERNQVLAETLNSVTQEAQITDLEDGVGQEHDYSAAKSSTHRGGQPEGTVIRKEYTGFTTVENTPTSEPALDLRSVQYSEQKVAESQPTIDISAAKPQEEHKPLSYANATPVDFLALYPLHTLPTDYPTEPASFRVEEMLNKFQFYAEIGGGLTQSYLIQTPLMSNWSLSGGLRYNRSKFAVDAGLSFETSYANDLEWNQRKTVYSFGASTLNTNVSYDRLYHFNVPLSLAYKVGGKHELALGVEGRYNIACRMNFATTSDAETPTALNSQEAEQLYYVRSNKLRVINVLPSFQYRYHFTSKLSVGAKFGTLLLNPIKEDVFTNEARSLPIQTNLNLRWTF